MNFNERVHAWIAATFYVALKDQFGERGLAAFTHATIYYATTRGRRMAMRAIRDGQPLTPSTYARYGEWVNSEDAIKDDISNQAMILEMKPDLVNKITRCPWHAQFKDMGLAETAGAAYCEYLDISIMKGFNPSLTYEVDQTLQTADCCIHRIKNIDYDENTDLSKHMEYVKGWDYHCAHSYYAYREVTISIFGDAGRTIVDQVLQQFQETYGSDMTEQLKAFANTNFNMI